MGSTEVAYWVRRRAALSAGLRETESESPGYQSNPPDREERKKKKIIKVHQTKHTSGLVSPSMTIENGIEVILCLSREVHRFVRGIRNGGVHIGNLCTENRQTGSLTIPVERFLGTSTNILIQVEVLVVSHSLLI